MYGDVIHLIFASITITFAIIGFVGNMFIAFLMLRSKRLLQLSVCFLVVIVAINDAFISLTYLGSPIKQLRVYWGLNNVTEFECAWQNIGKRRYPKYAQTIITKVSTSSVRHQKPVC